MNGMRHPGRIMQQTTAIAFRTMQTVLTKLFVSETERTKNTQKNTTGKKELHAKQLGVQTES